MSCAFRRLSVTLRGLALWVGVTLPGWTFAADPVAETLQRWEQASQTRIPPAIEDLEPRHGITHSAHELLNAIGLLGPIRANRLLEDFDWEQQGTLDGESLLIGKPRDDVDRLFFSSVEIALDDAGAVRSLRYRDREGTRRAEPIRWASPLRLVENAPVLLRPAMTAEAAPGTIQLAAFEEAEDIASAAPEKPAADPTVAPPKAAPEDVAQVLEAWTQAGKNIRSLNCRIRRYQYDSVWQVETRGRGRLYFEAPHMGLLELQPATIASGERSTRNRKDGQPYELVADEPITYHWSRKQLTKVNPTRTEYERFAIPEAFLEEKTVRTVSSFDVIWTMYGSPRRALPGLIETDLESLSNRFDWSIVSRNDQQILLSGRTVEAEERRHFSALQVVLDARTYLTKATKTIDSTGTRETVCIFEDVRANEPRRLDAASWEPKLQDYYELSGPRPAPPPSVE